MQILHPSIPRMLNLQRVPLKVTLITLFSSLALSYGAHVEGFPLYGIVFFGLLPLIPLIAFEEVWKYKHYGFWAIFSTIMILQLGHLGEHSAQVLQLLIHRGDASKAHGVFGQLDAEHVHFFWDSGVWIGALFLLYRFPKNVWLWVAVAFSSLHQVEHTYLETIYVF
ncbi:MAG TPA: hypothetical protein VKI20_02715, partial [Acidimicrobiales bacterium]|nr:hypothetical protein [Acidimicrobiales bacterium]